MTIHFLLSDNMDAVDDLWLVGDASLKTCYGTLMALKTQAASHSEPLPYIFEHYNILPYYRVGNVNPESSFLARFINSVVYGLNKNQRKLPKYVILILDKDLLENAKFNNFGATELIQQAVKYMINEIFSAFETCKEDVKGKHLGALHSSYEPRLIWVKMIRRPYIEGGTKYIYPHTRCFNEALEQILASTNYSHIVDINLPDDQSLFDRNGDLTNNGKILFWENLIYQIKEFDCNKTELQPATKLHTAASSQTHRKNAMKSSGNHYSTHMQDAGHHRTPRPSSSHTHHSTSHRNSSYVDHRPSSYNRHDKHDRHDRGHHGDNFRY